MKSKFLDMADEANGIITSEILIRAVKVNAESGYGQCAPSPPRSVHELELGNKPGTSLPVGCYRGTGRTILTTTTTESGNW